MCPAHVRVFVLNTVICRGRKTRGGRREEEGEATLEATSPHAGADGDS